MCVCVQSTKNERYNGRFVFKQVWLNRMNPVCLFHFFFSNIVHCTAEIMNKPSDLHVALLFCTNNFECLSHFHGPSSEPVR